MPNKIDDRLTMRDVHFALEETVPDSQVHLSYIAKDVAMPENTVEITDYTDNIPENINRFGAWQKFPIKTEPIKIERAVYAGSTVLGNPSGIINDDYPFIGWRKEPALDIFPPRTFMADIYITSRFFYETAQDIKFSALRLHINASGDMPDGYRNPGDTFNAYIYDPAVEVLITAVPPPGSFEYLCYEGQYTFERKEDGTHNGSYIIPMQQVILLPSGSMIHTQFFTRSKNETETGRAGYVLFLGASNYADPGATVAVDYMNSDWFNLANFYTTTDTNGYPINADCSDGHDGSVVYLGPFNRHRCGNANTVVDMDIMEALHESDPNFSANFVDTDLAGKSLPIHPLMGQIDLQLTDTSINSEEPSRPDIPLSWEYTLRFDAEIKTEMVKDAISIIDESGRKVPENKYEVKTLLPYTSNPLKTNIFKLKILFPDSLVFQEGKTLFVTYTKYLNGRIQTNFKEAINPTSYSKPVFDYFIDYGYSDPRILFKTGGHFANLPPAQFGTHYIWAKLSDSLKLSAALPIANAYSAWYPRIHKGAFRSFNKVVVTSTGTKMKDIIYYTPEQDRMPSAVNWAQYATELAASGNPSLDKFIKEVPVLENATTIRMRHHNIYFWDGDKSNSRGGGFDAKKLGWPDYIIPNLQDWHIEGGSFNAFPNHATTPKYSHGITLYKNDQFIPNSIIKDWDNFNGLLFLNTPLDFSDKIEVTYLSAQDYITGRTLDLNPTSTHAEASGVNRTFRIVLKPHWDTYTDDTNDPEPSGYKLAWHYLHDNLTGKYNATWDGFNTLIPGSTVGYDFTRPNTTVGLPDGTIILADISIREHNLHAVDILDARIRGGGIKNDKWFIEQDQLRSRRKTSNPNARKLRQKESKYYWDIGYIDGEPYQGDGVLVITIPLNKRTELHNAIVKENIGKTNIRKSERALVDSYYASNNTYNYTAITDGVTNSNYLTAIREYIDLQLDAWSEADSEIHRIIDKYIAFGNFYVILDEHNNFWPKLQAATPRSFLR